MSNDTRGIRNADHELLNPAVVTRNSTHSRFFGFITAPARPKMASDTNMSREEKEALLNARMEQIRKKNAELQKRYEEVEADKRNAEAVSSSFQETRRGAPPKEPVYRPKKAVKHHQPAPKQIHDPQLATPDRNKLQHRQRLTQDDGPPPDPSYRFLADKSRDRDDDDETGEQQDRHQGSRRHPGNFGGQDFDNVKSSMQKRRSYDKSSSPWHATKTKMEMSLSMTGRERREYENWKSERNRIEQDRMNRQRTSSGEWRREWDREKNDQKDDNIREFTSDSFDWSPRGRGVRGGYTYHGERQGRGRGCLDNSHLEGHEKDDVTVQEGTSTDIGNRRNIQIDQNTLSVCISNDLTAPLPTDDKRPTFSGAIGHQPKEGELSTAVRRDNRRQQARRSEGDRTGNWRDVKQHGDEKNARAENRTWNRNKFSKENVVTANKATAKGPDDGWEDDGPWEEEGSTSGDSFALSDCNTSSDSFLISEDGHNTSGSNIHVEICNLPHPTPAEETCGANMEQNETQELLEGSQEAAGGLLLSEQSSEWATFADHVSVEESKARPVPEAETAQPAEDAPKRSAELITAVADVISESEKMLIPEVPLQILSESTVVAQDVPVNDTK